MKRILAIDPSLVSLGYAHNAAEGGCETGVVRVKRLSGVDRLAAIRSRVEGLVDHVAPELVVYEGYAMGKFAGRMFDRAELGGILKFLFYSRNIPILLVPPTCLKLFATGKGNADKEHVMAAMARRAGRPFMTHDEADAFALLQMGIAYAVRRRRARDPRHYSHTAIRGCQLVHACGD